MRAIVATRQDKIVLGITIFSGLMFFVCLGLMLSNYRPLQSSNADIAQLNKQLYGDIVNGYKTVKSEIGNLPLQFSSHYEMGKASLTSFPMVSFNRTVESLIGISKTVTER